MKKNLKKIIPIALAACLTFGMTACGSDSVQKAEEPADTVIYSNIATTNNLSDDYVEAQAMAIKDGKIVFVGSENDAKVYVGDDTEEVDYTGENILPGFIDGHCHAYVSAENKVCDFNLTECKTAKECVDIISKYVADNPKDFYIGYGWLDNMFENGQPTADLLDAIDTDSPIYIKSEDCHSCWTNTAMMKKCGITKDSPDPNGGVIEHYDNGQPSGCFRDTAMDTLIKPNVPVYSVDKYKEILLIAQDDYMKLGYSAYNDVIIDVDSADNIVEAYSQLDKEGKLKCYINASYIVNNNEDTLDNIKHIKELADKTAGDHFKLTDVKIFMDGITESCTSYMCEAYANNSENYGVDRWSGEEGTNRLYEAAALINDLGMVAHFHAIGDAAVKKALDAAEYAKANSKNTDIKNVMTHIQFIKDEDVKRFAELDMIASCDLGWCYTDTAEDVADPDYSNIEKKNLGEERVDQEMRYKSLLDAGVTCAFATDYPATSHVDPFQCLEYGVTRMDQGVEETINNAQEALGIDDALRMITINAAGQLLRDEQIGSIEAGKQANFIVLNQDLRTCDSNDIFGETKLVDSYIDGVSVIK